MSLVMFGMLASVFVLVIVGVVLEEIGSEAVEDDVVGAVLQAVSLGTFLGAVSVVPLFQFNGVVSMGVGVLLSLQLGVLVFVVATAVFR